MTGDRNPLAGIDPGLVDWLKDAVEGNGVACAAPQPGRPDYPCIWNRAYHADHRDVFGNTWPARGPVAIVAPLPERNADGTVTVTTTDAGVIRLACPAWCINTHTSRQPVHSSEITHYGEPEWALAYTEALGEVGAVRAGLVQRPYSPLDSKVLVQVETGDEFVEVDPADARLVAAAVRAHADTLDQLADTVETLRAGEVQ